MKSVLLSSLPLLFIASTASAADWHHGAARYEGTVVEVATARLSALGLADLELESAAVLPVGSRKTVRFVQKHGGLPVVGGQAAVMVAGDGSVDVAVVSLARGLTVGTSPDVSEEKARTLALSRLGAPVMKAPATLAVESQPEGGRLVWLVDVPTSDGGVRVVVDARHGVVLAEHPLARHALGRVYPISKVVTPTCEDRPLDDLVAADPQHLTGWGGNLTVVNYLSGNVQNGLTVAQTVNPNSGEPELVDFLFDPPDPTDPADAFAQVGIYYHLTRMRGFYEGLGVDFSGPNWKLTAVANVMDDGAPMNNAFFSPSGIAGPFASPNMIGIGQGTQFDFAEDSDVFLHEMTHYVSHVAVGYNGGQTYVNSYGLHPFGGSIDEGISDYFACTANDDPLLGEASLAKLGAGRDLTDTSKRCPDDVIGEVHADGEIIGSFGWTLRTLLDPTLADQLVWGATSLLTMDASLGDFARGVRETAATLKDDGLLNEADTAAIEMAIAERGLDECDTVLPLREGEPRVTTLFGLDILGSAFGADCFSLKAFGLSLQSLYHYVVTPEPGATELRISVQMAAQGQSELDFSLYVRKNEHVTFASAGFLPEVVSYDYAAEHFVTENGAIVIDASSEPPFDPTASYHLAVVHQNCPLAVATITASLDQGTGGSGGAGGSEGVGGSAIDPPGGAIVEEGCGCRVPSGSAPFGGGAALASLAALAFLRRRRSDSW